MADKEKAKEKSSQGFKMKPIAPLMIEHRLIERMIQVIKEELGRINSKNRADVIFIDTAVDFIRTYADRTHHGKEEDILFRDLALKNISDEHKKITQELINEHIYARSVVAKVVAAKEKYAKGDTASLKEIVDRLKELTEFYPKHIEKEDRHFFAPVMNYFTRDEMDQMLNEMWEFDRRMIHEKYTKLVEKFETGG
jgi:hemerythrin-like domain-containing protein